jgi:predicted phosphoribosyltransferase
MRSEIRNGASDLPFPDVAARTVIVAEEGLATGAAGAAVLAVRSLGAQ